MIIAYDYILSHWDEYNLTDTKEEFIALINCLEAHDESIDSLHSAVFNCHDMFCGIFGDFVDDRDAVKAVLEFNKFMNVEELKGFLYDSLDYYRNDAYADDKAKADEEFYQTYFCDKWGDEFITRTTDGYVLTICC